MVLVLGAGGAVGAALVRALRRRGVATRVLVRRPVELEGVEVRVGDILTDAIEHAKDCDAIFAAYGLPWPQWDPAMVKLTTAAIDACLENEAELVFPTTLDGVKPIFDVPLPTPPPRLDYNDARVMKGELRNVMEDHVRQFVEEFGGRAVLVRSPDLFGPGVVRRPFGPIQSALLRGEVAPWYGPVDQPRPLVFVDDLAEVMVAAWQAERPEPWTELTLPGQVRSGREWAAAFGGRLRVRSRAEVWLRGLVDPEEREQLELMHNWTGSFCWKEDALRALLPDWRPTPLDEAVRRTRGR